MRLTRDDAASQVLAEFAAWIELPPDHYTASVRLFSLRLPPTKLLEALWVARSRKPDGGIDAFKYFCGVCHSMIREQRGEPPRKPSRSWYYRN